MSRRGEPGQVVHGTDRRRMAKEDRREQLLDVAARLVLDSPASALTMERLAENAGVSKSLPYTHFTSIDDALLALYEREAIRLGEFIWSRLEGADSGPEPARDRVRTHVTAYFDGLDRSGDLIGALTVPGTAVAAHADPRASGPRFTRRVLIHFHGVDPARAKVLASMVHAAVLGAGNALRRGVAARPDLEDATVHLIRSALAWERAA